MRTGAIRRTRDGHDLDGPGLTRLMADMRRQALGEPGIRQEKPEDEALRRELFSADPDDAPRCGVCGRERGEVGACGIDGCWCGSGLEDCPMRGGQGRDAEEIMNVVQVIALGLTIITLAAIAALLISL